MIPLTEVDVLSEAAIVGLRRRVHALAGELGFDSVVCTRIATVTSEAGRIALACGAGATVGVALTPGIDGIELSFPAVSTTACSPLERFFDQVRRTPAPGGGERLVGVVRTRRPGRRDPDFVERQRRALLVRSRDELMRDVQAQNEALERHQSELEATVAERTSEAHAARAEAERASRAKSEFLSNMSHELRTPLNGVLGYSQILQRDPAIVGDQRRSLESIQSCGQHLLTLINDVLDLSKIEAGQLELDPRPVRLDRLVRTVHDIVLPRAERHQLAFHLHTQPDLPVAIIADETKLKQVLVNLLGNSVKFTETGSVALEVERGTADRLVLRVRDTGIGMTPEEQSHVFDPFKQAEGGRRSGGTGLGLAISRRIVEAMGGSVSLASEKGVGTCFTVDLPMEIAEQALLESSAEHTLSGNEGLVLSAGASVSVLVVDDNSVNRDVLCRVLEDAGFTTTSAANGREALDALADETFDVVLMDIRMPVMDGIEATRRIRENPATADTRVVAVTADAFSDFRKNAAELGFDAYLSKPLRVDEVLRRLRKLLELELVPQSTAVPGAADDAEPAESTGDGTLPPSLALDLAERLAEAGSLGDFGALEQLADELVGHGMGPVASRVRAAAETFDFDRAAEVAADLARMAQGEYA